MRQAKQSTIEIPQGLRWLNGPAQSLATMRGKPVILHIFSYTCPQSLRSLEYVKRWAESYKKYGVQVIGVHTPEFRFATVIEEVQHAVRENDIHYPVIHDPEYKIWKMVKNEYWPRMIILGTQGEVVYDHAGEGAYAEVELALQNSLRKAGEKELPAIGPDASLAGAHCYRVTPEVHAGFLRGSIGNLRQFTPGGEEAFTDNGQGEEGVLYAHGHFAIHPEAIEHTRAVANNSEYLRLKYRAFGVQSVLRSVQGTKEVVVRLNKKPIPKDFCGTDIHTRKDGETVVLVQEGRLYDIVRASMYHTGSLEFHAGDAGWEMYTLSFTGGIIV